MKLQYDMLFKRFSLHEEKAKSSYNMLVEFTTCIFEWCNGLPGCCAKDKRVKVLDWKHGEEDNSVRYNRAVD